MKHILVIGGGGIGERHIRCFLKTGRAKVSVCEVKRERLEYLKTNYPISEIFASFDDIDLARFDGVVIATPAHLHIPIAIRCAKNGRACLIEKPLSVNLDNVDELLKIVSGKKLTVGIGYVRRSLPSYKKLKKLVEEGIIGTLKMGRINLSQEYPKYRPDYRDIYYAREEMGGGCILDAATHGINLAQYYFGEIKDAIGFYDHLELEGVEVEDSSIIILRFGNKALVDIFVNQFQKPNITEIELIGNKGNLKYTVNGEIHQITFCNNDSNNWEEIAVYRFSRDDPYIFQANEFLDALEGKNSVSTNIIEAKKALLVALYVKSFQKERRKAV
ncbi:MAG TPA: Gfo/Idh/MocA family oxidoreductase [bacterium]|nr:Gfo/Idh/MocA family oxidoreductase [bacterium]